MSGSPTLQDLLKELKDLRQIQANYQKNLTRLQVLASEHLDAPLELRNRILDCEEKLQELAGRIPEVEAQITAIQPETDWHEVEPITNELMIPGKRYAFLIGPQYAAEEQGLQALQHTGDDVDAVRKLLKHENLGGFHEVFSLKGAVRSYEIVKEMKKCFAQTEADDLVVLYFSGHVGLDADYGWYFLDSETSADMFSLSPLSLENIVRQFISRSKANHIVFVLDCLYHTENGMSVGREAVETSFKPLSEVDEAKQIAILSTLAQTVQEKEGASHGYLTYYLKDGMETGRADFSKNGRTTLDELVQYIRYAPHFDEQRPLPPEPIKWEIHSRGDIVLASTSDKPLSKGKYKHIADLLKKGEVIPFLGIDAVLPALPERLRHNIANLIGLDEKSCPLTLLSQYYELKTSRRDLYEKVKETILGDRYLQPADIHHLLARVEKPLIILTTMYDHLLEKEFQAQNKKYILLTHLVTPFSEEFRGKVMVSYFHGNEKGETEGEILSPERLILQHLDTYSLIYKLQGSLNLPARKLDEEQESLVISEEDYLSFLEWFCIPEPLNRPLKTKMLLFLGCSMCDWNFRVLMHALLKERQQFQRQPYAVRKNPSPIEELSWRKERLIELIDEDLTDFLTELADDMEVSWHG